MKITFAYYPTLLLATGFTAFSSYAQTAPSTTARPPVHHTATAAAHHPAAVAACVKPPAVSPKIPALPATVKCLKTMYTISSAATDLDPSLNPSLREALQNVNQSFSLRYVDLKLGTGEPAQQRKFYTVNYTGYLLDGTKFDSSLDRNEPFTFPYGANRVIRGWDTGFEGMRMGGKRRLYIPYQLAYGERGNGKIPPKAELIFDMELISQSDAPPAQKTPPTPPAQPGSAQPGTAPTIPIGAKPGTPAPATAPVSPAGAAAPPPTTSTTPASSTAPATPGTSTKPPQQ